MHFPTSTSSTSLYIHLNHTQILIFIFHLLSLIFKSTTYNHHSNEEQETEDATQQNKEKQINEEIDYELKN